MHPDRMTEDAYSQGVRQRKETEREREKRNGARKKHTSRASSRSTNGIICKDIKTGNKSVPLRNEWNVTDPRGKSNHVFINIRATDKMIYCDKSPFNLPIISEITVCAIRYVVR